MGTRSAIAIRTEDGGFKGRYVHWDGYPDGVGRAVRQIIERDGREKALEVLLEDHYGWSTVDGEEEQDLGIGREDGRFVAVPGYGVAYTTEQNQSSPDEWVTYLGDWGTEYIYIVEDDGTITTVSC
jgi:hypothetical protein